MAIFYVRYVVIKLQDFTMVYFRVRVARQVFISVPYIIR
jgi:hypothetical protein